jgi:putative tryptophan/tyrosine transport system substrate-binding protein
MRRREFMRLAGLMAVWPRVGRAQEARLPTILVLRKAQWRSVEDQFLQGLQDLGYIDGKTIHIELRSAEGRIDLLTPLAEELVRLRVSAVVALYTPVGRFGNTQPVLAELGHSQIQNRPLTHSATKLNDA